MWPNFNAILLPYCTMCAFFVNLYKKLFVTATNLRKLNQVRTVSKLKAPRAHKNCFSRSVERLLWAVVWVVLITEEGRGHVAAPVFRVARQQWWRARVWKHACSHEEKPLQYTNPHWQRIRRLSDVYRKFLELFPVFVRRLTLPHLSESQGSRGSDMDNCLPQWDGY